MHLAINWGILFSFPFFPVWKDTVSKWSHVNYIRLVLLSNCPFVLFCQILFILFYFIKCGNLITCYNKNCRIAMKFEYVVEVILTCLKWVINYCAWCNFNLKFAFIASKYRTIIWFYHVGRFIIFPILHMMK